MQRIPKIMFLHTQLVLFESNITSKYDLYVKYFDDLCNISERWARCFRNDELTRGSNTNNYVEAQLMVIKDSLLKRQRQFNINMFLIRQWANLRITTNVICCQLLMEHLMRFTVKALKELPASLFKVMHTFYLKFRSKYHFLLRV